MFWQIAQREVEKRNNGGKPPQLSDERRAELERQYLAESKPLPPATSAAVIEPANLAEPESPTVEDLQAELAKVQALLRAHGITDDGSDAPPPPSEPPRA